MRILFVGDVFGRPGRDALLRRLPSLAADEAIDLTIVNGENAASGAGITTKIARGLLAGGVDLITTGNHVYKQRDIYPFLDSCDRIVRPATYPADAPGRGLAVATARNGEQVAVINLGGALFMGGGISPFRIVDGLVAEATARAEHVVVDIHAEATSEKVALGHLLAGRVTAVLGTHTHVQTSDERVLPGGTAYITDVGMTGPRDSVIGVRTDVILRRFQTEMPQQFVVADGPVRIDYVIITAIGGRATAIERHEEIVDGGEEGGHGRG
jgi:2',3'-cyclic-nucleotide 2'-phosphodiesterase